MVFDVSIALTWILFVALFPMAFIWLRRAWRILARRDHSEVALRGGEPPADARRFAPAEAGINLVAGAICLAVIVAVLLGELDYHTWTAIAGSTVWMKLFAGFILRRHAHSGAVGAGR